MTDSLEPPATEANNCCTVPYVFDYTV